MYWLVIPQFVLKVIERIEFIKTALKFFGLSDDEILAIEGECTSLDDYESALNLLRWNASFDEIMHSLKWRKLRPLDRMHLRILKQIMRGSRVTPTSSPDMWRFKHGKTMYGNCLLEELRGHKMLTENNQITAKGEVWLLAES